MEMPQPKKPEPSDSSASRKTTRKRPRLARYSVPVLVVLGSLLLIALGLISVFAVNAGRYPTTEKPISDVLNMADHHALKSVTINGNDIVAISTTGQHYHALKEDGQSVTETLRHDGVTVSIDNGQQSAWMQGIVDIV